MDAREERALNTIMEYAASHGIQASVQESEYYNEEKNANFRQIQIDYVSPTINKFAFFYGVGDDSIIFCSVIFNVRDEYVYEIDDLENDFNQQDSPFVDFVVADESDNEVHMMAEFEFEEIDDALLDRLVGYLNEPFAQHLRAISM